MLFLNSTPFTSIFWKNTTFFTPMPGSNPLPPLKIWVVLLPFISPLSPISNLLHTSYRTLTTKRVSASSILRLGFCTFHLFVVLRQGGSHCATWCFPPPTYNLAPKYRLLCVLLPTGWHRIDLTSFPNMRECYL